MAPSTYKADHSSPTSQWEYDVFVSFRGEDTRKTFTDHLYKALCQSGVSVYQDTDTDKMCEAELHLLEAIDKSKIFIVVFSKNYASSSWCLEELATIIESVDRGSFVIPVFYDVDPSEVRKQMGGFGNAIIGHQQRFGVEKVDRWKAALTRVANYPGFDLQGSFNGYESKLIESIVNQVLLLVNRTYLKVAKYPVGIHGHVTKICQLVQSGASDDVQMIGIYGMGGIGKTTIAKAIYEKIHGMFDGNCFLGNVRSKCLEKGHAGLKCLQEQLLCKVLLTTKVEVDNVDEGISLIERRLRAIKVLIVIDDIDSEIQLNALAGERYWFGAGSTVIVTTRNANLLNGPGKDYEKYEVRRLDFDKSLQLFCWHTFKHPIPLEPFVEISDMIVSYAGGLPLALTVLGSHFRGRSSIQEWIDDFEKLRKTPPDDILKILRISYDALDEDTQRIFLEIACKPSGVRTLVDRCLLTEDLYVHDLVMDMAREVREELPAQPVKSRQFLSHFAAGQK